MAYGIRCRSYCKGLERFAPQDCPPLHPHLAFIAFPLLLPWPTLSPPADQPIRGSLPCVQKRAMRSSGTSTGPRSGKSCTRATCVWIFRPSGGGSHLASPGSPSLPRGTTRRRQSICQSRAPASIHPAIRLTFDPGVLFRERGARISDAAKGDSVLVLTGVQGVQAEVR